MKKIHILILPPLVCALLAPAGLMASSDGPSWDYSQQATWAELNDGSGEPPPLSYPYATCGIGDNQAPVNLSAKTVTVRLNRVRPQYSVEKPVFYNSGHAVQVNAPDDYTGSVAIGQDSYPLIQFHFHTPSEHTVDGKVYDAELHFVNIRADGKAAVVTSLIKTGAHNAEFQKILDHMPTTAGEKNSTSGVRVNPRKLLPDNLSRFYTYAGSLTTPPCSEGVNFFVFAQPIHISSEQLTALKGFYNNNNRALQPLNSRTISQAGHAP